MTSSWFHPMGNKVKIFILAPEPQLPPRHRHTHIHISSLSTGLPQSSLHPSAKCHSSYQVALSTRPSQHLFSTSIDLIPKGLRWKKQLLLAPEYGRIPFGLNCHTFVKVFLSNSSKPIPVYLTDLFSARTLTDTLRKDQLIKSANLWGE